MVVSAIGERALILLADAGIEVFLADGDKQPGALATACLLGRLARANQENSRCNGHHDHDRNPYRAGFREIHDHRRHTRRCGRIAGFPDQARPDFSSLWTKANTLIATTARITNTAHTGMPRS